MKNVYYNRNIENVILEASQYFSVISVTGPRQSGKSTLLKHLFPDCRYYSMKDLDMREFAESDPRAFLNQHDGRTLFIDEVQMVPQLLGYIQGIVDEDSERRILLSGSSNFEILKGLSESLAGRVGVFELLPMNLAESHYAPEVSMDDILFNGFYPSVCSGKNKSRFFYPSYVKTYLERDVRGLLNVQNQMLFVKFMKLCAARVGAMFNASEVANEVGVDSKTIKKWLSVLQASYLVTLLQPYYGNISKRLVKTPKLYFNDTGLACYLLEIESAKQLSRDKMRGALFENYVVMEVLKHRYNKGMDGGAFFYRDSNQNEVDILLKEEGEITAIEVKSAETYHKSFEKTLRQIDSWIKEPVRRKVVVYAGDFENTAGEVEVLNYRHLLMPSLT